MNAPLIAPPPTARQADRDRREANKLAKFLRRNVGQAIADYNMIEDGDKVMVCLSGGKDSYALLDILPRYLTDIDVPFRIEEQDTYSIVKRVIPEGNTTCSLCSRLRRGVLYRVASELGATKIALGHHRDDILQTLFLNLFFGAKMKAMPPKLASDDGRHVVIRPLAYVSEVDLEAWAEVRSFPIIPCDLCGSQPNLQRQQVKAMLREWDKRFPGRVQNLFRGLANVVPSHLMDKKLFNFVGLKAGGVPDPEGDHAFDPQEIPAPAQTIRFGERDDSATCGEEGA